MRARAFLLGFVLGGAAVGLLWWSLGPGAGPAGGARGQTPEASRHAVPPPEDLPLRLEGRPAPPPPPPEAAPPPSRPDGGLVLRPGEGAVLATGEVLPRGHTDGADVVCLDVWAHSGARLASPHGGVEMRFAPNRGPIQLVDPGEVRALAPLAPSRLEADAIGVFVSARSQPGFGFVRAGDGAVWCVWTDEVSDDPGVLDRWVSLRCAPARQGDGDAVVPPLETSAVALDAADQERMQDYVLSLRALEGAFPNMAHQLIEGRILRLESPPASFALSGMVMVRIDGAYGGKIATNAHDGVWIVGDFLEGGAMDLDHHCAGVIEGDLLGDVDVEDHASLVVTGDVRGRVRVRFHAALRVDGDVRGAVRLEQWARVVLRRRLTGRLEAAEADFSHLYLAWPMDRIDIERLPGPGPDGSSVLHVPASDLGAGEHGPVGAWSKVIVGDPYFDERLR